MENLRRVLRRMSLTISAVFERLCRYISCRGSSSPVTGLHRQGGLHPEDAVPGKLAHERSECFGHGTTQVAFEPVDFIARLAALVPKPFSGFARHLIALKCNSIGDVDDQQAIYTRIQDRRGKASHRSRLFRS